MLPQLRELERRFPRRLAVVGVHSGKFVAERVTARIRDAAARLGVAHPVVNDRQFRLWRAYAVRAWPTVVLVDPRGHVVAMHAGELTADVLAAAVERILARHDPAPDAADRPAPDGDPAAPAPPAPPPAALRYPGKVALGPPAADGTRSLAVADSGHHRVLVGTLDARGRRLRVERVVGRGEPTWAAAGVLPHGGTRDALAAAADGPADRATFDNPQGLAFAGDTLYVADAGNHAVRAVDLATGAVRTVAGTGVRRRTRADGAAGALASPWDVAVAGDALVVAMAGTHQLWTIPLAAGRAGAARPHAGGRGEDLLDGPLADALLAQPMGVATDGAAVWFADAESSAIRVADLAPDGAVRTIVGTGLFDFGDRDGVGDEARLQHPQAVAHHPSGRLLVADSYNDALKWVDPAARRVETWIRGLHEPGGLAVGEHVVYVADTNAHRVLVVDEATGRAEALEVVGRDGGPLNGVACTA